jgi:hypothetical protein
MIVTFTLLQQIIFTANFNDLVSWSCSNPRTASLKFVTSTINIESEGEVLILWNATEIKQAARIIGVINEYSDCVRGVSSYAKALSDYEVSDPELLSFTKGDIIFIKEKGESGWLVGELFGRVGAVPAEYIELLFENPNEK